LETPSDSKKIKEVRESLQMTQAEFASELGVKQSYYSEIERGKKDLTSKMLRTLFLKLGISPLWYFFNKGSLMYAVSDNLTKDHVDLDELIDTTDNELISMFNHLKQIRELIGEAGLKVNQDQGKEEYDLVFNRTPLKAEASYEDKYAHFEKLNHDLSIIKKRFWRLFNQYYLGGKR
jgi:transcriptional regulator with XRE-family HTH domain